MPRPLLLLVDDSTEMGLIVTSLGRRSGCDVTVCPDAATAWEALSQRRPDLVLLDVNLPGASGLDWLRRLRAAPEFAGLPVALYTHWGLPADVAAGLDAGVDFVFDKDLASRPADWQRRLAEVLTAGPDSWPKAAASPTMKEGGGDSPLTMAWVVAFNKALHHPSIRRATREVMRSVLRRALTRTFAPRILPQDLEAWIAPGGTALDSERLPASLAPESPTVLAACLAEQMGRLLGNEAGSAFRNALTEAFPDLARLASWS